MIELNWEWLLDAIFEPGGLQCELFEAIFLKEVQVSLQLFVLVESGQLKLDAMLASPGSLHESSADFNDFLHHNVSDPGLRDEYELGVQVDHKSELIVTFRESLPVLSESIKPNLPHELLHFLDLRIMYVVVAS